CARRLDYFDYW
nr:immunoglobulin heavy chain junction region [Mus musculus]